MFKIAIDLMGGDNAPIEPIRGVESFIKSNPEKNIFFYLVGEEKIISNHLKNEIPKNKFIIINSSESINMNDNPQMPPPLAIISMSLSSEEESSSEEDVSRHIQHFVLCGR